MDEKENHAIQQLLENLSPLQGLQKANQTDQIPDNHSVVTAKIVALCVLFLATTICGCFPFLLNRWLRWTDENNSSIRSAMVVKGLLYFGGGVLLCTTFLHILPDVSEDIENLQESKLLPELTFNLPHLLMCAGFFAIFFFEEIVHSYIHKYRKNTRRGSSQRNSKFMRGQPPTGPGTSIGLSKEELIDDDMENQKPGDNLSSRTSSIQSVRSTDQNCNEAGHAHTAHILDEGDIASALRGPLIILALSIHEIFEGLAVGLQSQVDQVWYLFGAVSAHKLVLAFCVGVELMVNRTRLWLAIVYIVIFAIVSPLGILIGIFVSSGESVASGIPAVILQGLASGTLLYVVFFEILSKHRSGLINYAAFLFGFLLMFGIMMASE